MQPATNISIKAARRVARSHRSDLSGGLSHARFVAGRQKVLPWVDVVPGGGRVLRGVEQLVAREAHNLEVPGSNPGSPTHVCDGGSTPRFRAGAGRRVCSLGSAAGPAPFASPGGAVQKLQAYDYSGYRWFDSPEGAPFTYFVRRRHFACATVELGRVYVTDKSGPPIGNPGHTRRPQGKRWERVIPPVARFSHGPVLQMLQQTKIVGGNHYQRKLVTRVGFAGEIPAGTTLKFALPLVPLSGLARRWARRGLYTTRTP